MTIIKNSAHLWFYPYHCLHGDAYAMLLEAKQHVPATTYLDGVESLFKSLECYLAITSQTITVEILHSETAGPLFQGFLGAIAGDDLGMV